MKITINQRAKDEAIVTMAILSLATVAMILFHNFKTDESAPVPTTTTTTLRTRPAPSNKPKRYYASHEKKVVAVLDTGFKMTAVEDTSKLCSFGHKDFSSDQKSYKLPGINDPVPVDVHGHGTHIAGTIVANAGEADYCLVIVKYFSKNDDNLANTVKAIRYAKNIKADYINYSGGGKEYNSQEASAVSDYINNGGQFIAAAGNDAKNINIIPYFPAMDDNRVVVVGSKDGAGNISFFSNFGDRVDIWENGENVLGFGVTMSGTSQAAAIATAKMVQDLY